MTDIDILLEWEKHGRVDPVPHLVKELCVKEYAGRFGCKVLVESGSYRGEMIAACKDCFDAIYSIELSEHYWGKCCERFECSNHISLCWGDSREHLPGIIEGLTDKAIFWLDGHYSGGVTALPDDGCITPVLDEVRIALSDERFRHVVLIDDARCFDVEAGWPHRVGLIECVRRYSPDADIAVVDDIVRII